MGLHGCTGTVVLGRHLRVAGAEASKKVLVIGTEHDLKQLGKKRVA